MDKLLIPWLFVGPSGSGKLSQARKWIEEAHQTKLVLPLESRTFQIGDGYEARVLASPYHFEIDIPNLSMQDKQIIGDLLTTFFSSRDVLSSLRSSTRKLVILRRAHALSLPAAVRVRSILQQYVMPPDVTGLIWITAREVTGPLSLLEDAFVRYRIPRMSFEDWTKQPSIPPVYHTKLAWEKCEGRVERIKEIVKFFPEGNIPMWPRRIQDFYDDMIKILIERGKSTRKANMDIIVWIRGRVYQALSLCQTGPDIIDSCASALIRQYDSVDPKVFWKVMTSLASVEPHTSYRTPLSLEHGILQMYETIRTYTEKKEDPVYGDIPKSILASPTKECPISEPASKAVKASNTIVKDAPAKKRAAPRKKKDTGTKLG